MIPALIAFFGFFLFPAINLWIAPPTDKSTMDIELLAPGAAEKSAFETKIRNATEAEIERMSELGFILEPSPYSLPVQVGRTPGLRDGREFSRFIRKMERVGCVDNAKQVNLRNDIDEDTIAELESELLALNPGAAGSALLRQNYHLGLLAFCKGDFGSSLRAFDRVVELTNESGQQDTVTQQYRFVATAGQRMALVQTGGVVERGMPELQAETSGLDSTRDCTENSAGSCRLFRWPAARTELSYVHEFLATPDADGEDFATSIDKGFDGGGNLASYNFATVVAALAKSGQFDKVRERVRAAESRVPTWQAERNGSPCQDIDRIAALGWIAGMPAEEIGSCENSPYTTNFSSSDADRVEEWGSVNLARQALLDGNLALAHSELSSEANSDETADGFREGVRSELFEHVADQLRTRLGEAPAEGAAGTQQIILDLLRSDKFGFTTRLGAEMRATYGNIWAATGIVLLATLVLGGLGWMLWNLLIGYAFTFTQRHHLDAEMWAR